MSTNKTGINRDQLIAAQLFVAKQINKQPRKVIKFLQENEKIFPNIDTRLVNSLKKEHGITDEDIKNEPTVNLEELSKETSEPSGEPSSE